MSEQDGPQASTKRHRSRQTSKQNGIHAPALQHPANDDGEAWRAYWKQQGQRWRTEPEIDVERQKYLDEHRNIKPGIEQGIYPFKDIEPKLTRADIEWLLATHENEQGPIDWSDESQRERKGVDLRGTDLRFVNLAGLPLACIRGGLDASEWSRATPQQREMAGVHMEGAYLLEAHLEGASLSLAHLEGAYLRKAYLAEADFRLAYLEGIYLRQAHLEGADCRLAHLERSLLYEAHMERAILRGAHLEGADLRGAHLARADLKGAIFDIVTKLESVTLSNEKFGSALFSGIHWGDADLSVVDWTQLKCLGDEHEADQRKANNGNMKDAMTRLNDYRKAVIANRQLAVALQGQGLNEDAARFAYRAQKLQRVIFRRQRKFGLYLFSSFLDLLTGYGYKPIRSFLTYLLVIGIFAAIYYNLSHHLAWNEAIVISMTAFHGRGFFPDQFHPGDPQALVAAIEAFVGLLIEVTLIATLTQRLFGK